MNTKNIGILRKNNNIFYQCKMDPSDRNIMVYKEYKNKVTTILRKNKEQEKNKNDLTKEVACDK